MAVEKRERDEETHGKFEGNGRGRRKRKRESGRKEGRSVCGKRMSSRKFVCDESRVQKQKGSGKWRGLRNLREV